MNKWYDNCLADGFWGIFISIMGVAVLCLTIVCSFKLFMRSSNDFETQFFSIIMFILGFCILGIYLFFFLRLERKTFKSLSLYSGRISGYCYLRTKFNIDFSEIAKIQEYKISFIMKQMKLFGGEKKGFEIKLKNGKSYLVSPHMSDMENLKQTLIDGMNSING